MTLTIAAEGCSDLVSGPIIGSVLDLRHLYSRRSNLHRPHTQDPSRIKGTSDNPPPITSAVLKEELI